MTWRQYAARAAHGKKFFVEYREWLGAFPANAALLGSCPPV
jgi:hypothetical protein